MEPRDVLVRHVDEALGDDPRLALIAVRKLVTEDVPWLELQAVACARAYGYNWARIGRLLQRSRQALRTKYRATAPLRFELSAERQLRPASLDVSDADRAAAAGAAMLEQIKRRDAAARGVPAGGGG